MSDSIHRAVVVTGTSSGIGRACALRLTHEGFTVFASVRKPSDATALRAEAGERLLPLQLDVTDHTSVAAAAREAAEQMRTRGEVLAGLVNNAGIGLFGPLEYLPLEDIRRILEVNVLGQIAVTQAFLPLLRTGHGRIVNIGSVGDRIAIPFGGALNGTKSAFASMSDTLRMELRPWGIHVVIIEPGSIATAAVDKTLGDPEAMLRRMGLEAERHYGRQFRRFVARTVARERRGSPPEVVADAVLRALRDRRPRRRYPVGKDAALLVMLPRLVPDRLLDRLRLRLLGLPTRFGALAAKEGGSGSRDRKRRGAA
jgi:NAD(P)-dependent dehydrogenase (short-subunit alcohol dehydrogenase family)